MKTTQLAQMVASENALDERQARELIDSVLDLISSSIAAGVPVRLRGFGTFTLKVHPPRRVHDRTLGYSRWIGEGRTPHFKPSRSLKDKVRS